MKKILILLLCLVLAGCSGGQTTKKKKSTTTTVEPAKPVTIGDVYNKTYVQKKIIYANKNQYEKKKDALNKKLTYVIKKSSIVFETNLKYDKVTYEKASITSFDQKKIKHLSRKYIVKTDGKTLGITLFFAKSKFYIANNTLDQNGYTYIALLTKKTKKKTKASTSKKKKKSKKSKKKKSKSSKTTKKQH